MLPFSGNGSKEKDKIFKGKLLTLEKEMETHSCTLAWKTPWGRKESDTTSLNFSHHVLYFKGHLPT